MRSFIKRIADAVALVLVLPAVGLYQLSSAIGVPESVFPGYSQCFSLIPGLSGVYLRRAFYRCVLPRCGRDVCISFGSVFSHSTSELGNRVYIGVGCMIGDATLEDDVLIGSHVSIINGRRQHGIERPDIPIREQPGEYPRIVIGSDSWIGDRSTVTVSVGSHVVIGAASLVLNSVPDWGIVAGNPGKLIRFRDRSPTAMSTEVANHSSATVRSTEPITADLTKSRVVG